MRSLYIETREQPGSPQLENEDPAQPKINKQIKLLEKKDTAFFFGHSGSPGGAWASL